MAHIQATGFYMIHQWYAVENFTATAISDVQIDLAWDIIQAGMTGIVIEWSTDGVNYTELDFVGGTETSYQVLGLTTNTQYWFRIRGVKSSTYSEYCTPADDWTAMKLVFTSRGDGTTRTLIGAIYAGTENVILTIDGNGKFYSSLTGISGEATTKTVNAGSSGSTYVQVTSGSSNVYIFHKNQLLRIGYGNPWGSLSGGLTNGSGGANSPSVTFTYSQLARSLTHFGLSLSNQGNGLVTGTVTDLPPLLENLTFFGGFTMTGSCVDFPSTLTYINLGGSAISGNISGLPSELEYFKVGGTNTLTGDIAVIPNNVINWEVTGNNTLSGNIADLPQGELETLYISGSNTISGSVADLDYNASVLTSFRLFGNNTVSGAPSDIPSSLLIFELGGNSNTFSGDIAGIPATLDYFNVSGNSSSLSGDVADLSEGLLTFNALGPSTITGDIANFPSTLTAITVYGSNTLSGDLSNLPAGLTTCAIVGSNTINGNVSGMPTSITFLSVVGLNTITGDIVGLPSSLTSINLQGNNTVSGSVAGFSANIRSIIILGNNTITGTVAQIPATITGITIEGANTISGDLADISNAITSFSIKGNSTISVYTSGKTWSNGFIYSFSSIPISGGLDATEIDNLFIDLDTSWTTTRNQSIDMRGTNAAPTATSAAARASLISKGRIIYVNS